MVKTDILITVGSSQMIPDFCLYDESKQLMVVIEIDEPYSIAQDKNLIPVHVKGEDDLRNQLLLSTGWKVIRFAEEQIALFPEQCCSDIDLFLNDEPPAIGSIRCWTREEALAMIQSNYRNSYLPVEFSGLLKNHSNLTFRSFEIRMIERAQSKNGKIYFIVKLKNHTNGESFSEITQSWIEDDRFLDILKGSRFYDRINQIKPLKDDEICDPWFLSWILNKSRIQGIGTANERYFNFSSVTPITILENESNLSKIDDARLNAVFVLFKAFNVKYQIKSKKK